MEQVVNSKFPLPSFGERGTHIKRMIKIEKNGANGDLATDKENKPAVICLPPLGEYLDNVVFAETGNNLSGGCPFQDVETMFDKITRQVLLRLLKI